MALLDKKKESLKKESIKSSPVETKKAQNESEENFFDGVIDLSVTRKKRFHVNRGLNDEGILELNTSDMSIITRLEDLYPRLQQLSQDASVEQLNAQEADSDEKVISKTSQLLKTIDIEMRKIIDDIFQSNVSEVCAPTGSMFDPFNGEFRFEHIVDVISKLYEDNIKDEFTRVSNKLKKRTDKYTKG